MGKIFGIADLPVSTIMTALEETRVPEPVVRNLSGAELALSESSKVKIKTKLVRTPDADVVELKRFAKSNPIIRLRQGFGKLMSHFSKAQQTK